MTPTAMRKVNGWLTVGWVLAGVVVSVFAFLRPDNPYLIATLVFISFWANAAGHLGAWQAGRVEERQIEEQEED